MSSTVLPKLTKLPLTNPLFVEMPINTAAQVVLVTEGCVELAVWRSRLAEEVLATLDTSIETLDLESLFWRVSAVQSVNRQALSGAQTAALLQRLVKNEMTVGGPYTDHDGVARPLANALIALFLHREAADLPGLTNFLVGVVDGLSSNSLQSHWLCYLLTKIR